jgi:hypothetical protein
MRPVVRHSLMLGLCVLFTAAVYQRVAATGVTMPALLSETGIHMVQGSAESKVQGSRTFSPQYPLWSDGAAKRRWVHLPEGATIDVSDPERWEFPEGTKFWKEFAVGGRKVETRFLWKHDGEWRFATYAWNDAQTDATLVPENGLLTNVEVAPGKRHRIPGSIECRACHVTDRVEILGFTALQLSTLRDPDALHAEPLTAEMITLRTLHEEGRLSPARPDWLSTPPRIAAPDRTTRTVLGYLSTNCGTCHNSLSDLASLDLDLKATTSRPVAPCPTSLKTTLERPGRWEIASAAPGTSRRLAPSRPELSTLLARMKSRRPTSQMPPLGTVVVDDAAVALLTTWIESDVSTWQQRRSGCDATLQ